jgi:hypothetical protein
MLAGEDAAEPEEADGVDEPGDEREDREGGRQRVANGRAHSTVTRSPPHAGITKRVGTETSRRCP